MLNWPTLARLAQKLDTSSVFFFFFFFFSVLVSVYIAVRIIILFRIYSKKNVLDSNEHTHNTKNS